MKRLTAFIAAALLSLSAMAATSVDDDKTGIPTGGGGGSGTVTSVGAIGANGISISGSPVTTAGSVTFSLGDITPTSVNTGTATATRFNGPGAGLTGTAASLTVGTATNVTTNANLTGPITSTGNATAVAAQTGTGSTFVMQASPSITTPTLSTPSFVGSAIVTQSASTVAVGINATGNATGRRAWAYEGDGGQVIKFRRWSDSFGAPAAAIWGIDNSISADTLVFSATVSLNGSSAPLYWNGDTSLSRTAVGVLSLAKAPGTYSGSALILGPQTVAQLPVCAAGTQGARATVTDATATTFLSTVAGGGSSVVPVMCNATNWVIG